MCGSDEIHVKGMTRLDLFEIGLSKSWLSSWHVAPLLDNRLLDLPWVGTGPWADLLGDVNALLSRLEQGHQFGDVLALLLGLKVTGLLGNLWNNSLLPVKALLWARFELTTWWPTELTGNLFTLSLRREFLNRLPRQATLVHWPFWAFLKLKIYPDSEGFAFCW